MMLFPQYLLSKDSLILENIRLPSQFPGLLNDMALARLHVIDEDTKG